MKCQKCGSNYFVDNEICGHCGEIYRPPDWKPYLILNCASNFSEGKKAQVRGQCTNCGRKDLYLTTGLCGTCRNAVRGVKRNTDLWFHRLAAVKDKIQNHRYIKNLTREEQKKRASQRKMKTCRICERKITVIQDGLCNYCNREAVRQILIGNARRTPESEAALYEHAQVWTKTAVNF